MGKKKRITQGVFLVVGRSLDYIGEGKENISTGWKNKIARAFPDRWLLLRKGRNSLLMEDYRQRGWRYPRRSCSAIINIESLRAFCSRKVSHCFRNLCWVLFSKAFVENSWWVNIRSKIEMHNLFIFNC